MKLGTDEFGKVFLGDDFVERIYQGNDQIYSIYKDPKDAEIVFRPTDNKEQLSVPDPYFGYAKLDCVKGKSLVWNQMLQNGNFADGVTNWDKYGGNYITYSVSNGVLSMQQLGGGDNGVYQILSDTIVGHKVLVQYTVTSVTGSCRVGIYRSNTNSSPLFAAAYVNVVSDVGIYAFIYDVSLENYTRLAFGIGRGGDGTGISIKNIIVIDLTRMFGSGHEPSTVAEFEAMFPLPYYEYNPGALISNDAQSLNTVGFNQWDEEWEGGSINPADGENADSAFYIRSKNHIPCFPSSNYYYKMPAVNGYNYIYYYDINKNFISARSTAKNITGVEFATPANCYYIRFVCYSTTYNNDICINLSDASFNGQYEPYWESSLPLGLDYLPIKSHNIWDEEWELGYLDQHTGEPIDGNGKRAKNFIGVFPSTIYYGKSVATGMRIFEYDTNKNFLTCNTVVNNGTFVTSNNTYFIKFQDATPSYNNDICINVSDPNFNGQYEPYALRGGLKGAGSVYDLGRVEDDGYIHEVTKVMGEVDLGSLEWINAVSSNGFFRTIVPYIKQTENTIVGITSKYTPSSITNGQSLYNATEDKAFVTNAGYGGGLGSFAVRDSIFTNYTTTQVATAMNGVKLIYELATPITYELVTPIPAIYKVDKNGTEQATFPSHSDGSPSAPLCAEIGYPK